MSKYLTKNLLEYRVDSLIEVEAFHDSLKNDSTFTLDTFAYQQKQVKSKGEMVDEYYIVKAKLIFNDPKDPISQINIEYEVE